MESVEISEAEVKAAPKERIVLDNETMSTIDAHINLVRERLGDVVSVSPKQMVNFLLQRRADELTDIEIDELKAKFADKLKVLQIIVERAKLAKKEGREYSIDDEIKIFETLSVSGNQRSKRGRKPRSTGDENRDVKNDSSPHVGDVGAVKIDAVENMTSQSPIRKKSKAKTNSTGDIDLEISS